MAKPTFKTVGGILTVILIVAGASLNLIFEPEYTTFKRDGTIIAREWWTVSAERTFEVKDSGKCDKILAMQGSKETSTRCYYPPNFYQNLARSLISTKIIPDEIDLTVKKSVPYYAYGTQGSYAGVLTELFAFNNLSTTVEEFPSEYYAEFSPKDTRNYQLVWRITNLKESPYSDGNYTACSYQFGYAKIDLRDSCSALQYIEIKGSSFKAFFKPSKGYQKLNPIIYDPEKKEEKPIVKQATYVDCIAEHTEEVYREEPIYSEKEAVTHPNGTTDRERYISGYQDVFVNSFVVCDTPADEIRFADGKNFYPEENQVRCSQSETEIVCDSYLDGNGDGICKAGESCFIFNRSNSDFKRTDYFEKSFAEVVKR